jgi:hypothetical protein
VRDCSKCTVIAGRTGDKALQTRFARLLRAISNATVHLEQNRARAVQNEQDFPVRRDITLRFMQAGLSLESELEIDCICSARWARFC